MKASLLAAFVLLACVLTLVESGYLGSGYARRVYGFGYGGSYRPTVYKTKRIYTGYGHGSGYGGYGSYGYSRPVYGHKTISYSRPSYYSYQPRHYNSYSYQPSYGYGTYYRPTYVTKSYRYTRPRTYYHTYYKNFGYGAPTTYHGTGYGYGH